MAWRWGPGPVFAVELRGAARRWQTYAARAGFVALLLAAFGVVWWVDVAGRGPLGVNDMARVGERFYYGLVGTQLALIILAAPAATAGAVSQDRTRGGLLHLLITDLSDAEIVLGKLFARLAPVLALVACGLPVPGIVALLGGIDPTALVGAYLVTAGSAVLGCTIALTLSVWAERPSEALLATYLVLAALLLPCPVWKGLAAWLGAAAPPTWFAKTNPFWLAFAPYAAPRTTGLADALWFLAVTLALSAGLAAVAVARVRAVTVARAGRPDQRRRGRTPAPARVRLPGPSLEGNPVLWREWHRRRPSRWSRRVWWAYGLLAAGFGVVALAGGDRRFAAWVVGFQVAIGLLLFSAGAVTSLAEERAHGSLDLLLTTPLTTGQVLWGKWWGTFRVVPRLAVLPVLMLGPAVLLSGTLQSAALTAALILAYGAAFTSLGLALAIWVSRPGRAALLSATVCVLLTVGWLLFAVLLFSHEKVESLGMGSPWFGPANLAFRIPDYQLRDAVFRGALWWTAGYLVAAAALMAAAFRTFERCLGRVRQRPVPAARRGSPRRAVRAGRPRRRVR